MNSNKKVILFVVDYGLESPNSVGQILRNIAFSDTFGSFEKYVFVRSVNFCFFDRNIVANDVTQITVSNHSVPHQIFRRNIILCLWFKVLRLFVSIAHRGGSRLLTMVMTSNLRVLKKIFNVDFALYLTGTPNEYAMKSKIPYSYFLYDTYLSRPGVAPKFIEIEERVIKKSIAYYQAPFFYTDYHAKYPEYSNIKCLAFPLYPTKEEVDKAKSRSKGIQYKFSYFGQMQDFRNIEEIAALFESVGIYIDVFSWQHPIDSKSFVYHKTLIGDDYFKAIVESEYLLVFDNNEPFAHYMPSKLYQFIAFSKPIVLFTKNDKSATIDFLKDYPYFYKFDLRYTDVTKNFMSFIERGNNFSENNLFDEYDRLYSRNVITKVIRDDFISKLLL